MIPATDSPRLNAAAGQKKARKPPVPVLVDSTSPWLSAAAAGAYLKRSKRYVHAEIKAGRLRAARIGAEKEILTRREWLDQLMEDQAQPVFVTARRRA